MGLSEAMASLRARLLGDQYRYTALPDQGSIIRPHPNGSKWPDQTRRFIKLGLGAAILLVVGTLLFMFRRVTSCRGLYDCSRDSPHLWGQYSPYFSAHSDISSRKPQGCELTFVQILSRHGARDPTMKKTVIYNELVTRIQATTTEYGPGYEFLREFNYTLGSDELTLVGQRELVQSGKEAHRLYGGLADEDQDVAFIRSSGQHRVVQSALNWTQGFFGPDRRDWGVVVVGGGGEEDDDDDDDDDNDHTAKIVVIPEGDGFNNTLSHGLCPAFEAGIFSDIRAQAQKAWADLFVPPLTDRLNRNLRGASLTDSDTVFFMDLCPMTSVAQSDGSSTAFCDLFSTDEWRSYDYYQTLGKYYGFHMGNPLGPTQGVGFVNELVARLTETPVRDHTSSNRTLDEASATFPLGRHVYADFTHDNVMMSVYGALGLYNTSAVFPLPQDERRAPTLTDGFSASWLVPFAARMYVEKMRCPARHRGRKPAGDEEERVRVIINGRVVPLERCGADSRGMCKLSAFVESLGFAKMGGGWDQCFE